MSLKKFHICNYVALEFFEKCYFNETIDFKQSVSIAKKDKIH